MDISEEISHQRVKHIISSYSLNPEASDRFNEYLNGLLTLYPVPILELALVETVVDNWLMLPFQRGPEFLSQVHQRIHAWKAGAIAPTLTPDQFQQITGLDPRPIFTASDLACRNPEPYAATAPSADVWFQFDNGDRVPLSPNL